MSSGCEENTKMPIDRGTLERERGRERRGGGEKMRRREGGRVGGREEGEGRLETDDNSATDKGLLYLYQKSNRL